MSFDSSDFITDSNDPTSVEWSRETSLYYLTRQQSGSRVLLRKSLKPQYLDNPRLRETLRKEYEIGSMVGMDTEHVVNYYQMVDTPEECYLTMDFVEGSTLAEMAFLEPKFFCNQYNAERLLLQILRALHSIHNHQVVHLDLKPSNIMLTRVSHDVRIIDLGFCYADAYQDTMGMTDEFAAPEQKDGSGEVDARTDIYACGKIMQWLADSLGDKCAWRKKHDFKVFVGRCLNKEKDERWQSADEIALYVTQLRAKRRNMRYLLAAFVALCVLVSTYLFFIRPVKAYDMHVLYGNFSLLNRTCGVVGKIADDEKDPHWQGNLYVCPEIKHWGITFKVTEIADNAYYQDSTFQTIYVPPTIQRIGVSAFEECTSLESIHIPEGVTEIGTRAFFLATGLTEVQFPSTLRTIPAVCFHRCKFKNVYIPEGVTDIELDAFAYSSELQSIYLPESLQRIARGVFWQCNRLESISLPANLTAIGEYTFMGCTKLKQIENHAINPQSVMSVFDHPAPEIHLLVPEQSVEKYKQSPEWSRLITEPLPVL